MLKEIEKRRSIRQYLNKPIEKEKLKEVLHAGMCAPSARNTQSTRYMIVTNRKALDEMPTLQPYMQMMKQAPCAILVFGDLQSHILVCQCQCGNRKYVARSCPSRSKLLLVCNRSS